MEGASGSMVTASGPGGKASALTAGDPRIEPRFSQSSLTIDSKNWYLGGIRG